VLDVENTHLVDEGVTSKFALLTRYDLQPESFIATKGGGLGYGLPATVGAAIAEEATGDPRDVVGYIGDGSYLYYPNTMYTAAAMDLDLTVIVPDNRNYRILKDNTVEMMGGTEDDYEFVGMDFEPHVDIPANAESHGCRGTLVETPQGMAGALEEALHADGPDVVDVLVHD
jgi:benzoylformate decarboxylase